MLPIPATVTSISSCRVLNLSYVLTGINLHVRIPITIGNVPFRGGESTEVGTSTMLTTGPYVAPRVWAVPDSFNYSAAHAPVNIGLNEYTMGETQYAPVYGFVTDYQFAPP